MIGDIMMDPPAEREATGKFLLRVPPGLHALLRAAARTAGLSLNEYCTRKLAAPTVVSAETGAALLRAAHLFGPTLVAVVLFGSTARGEAGDGSDVDLLVVLEDSVPLTRDLYRRWDDDAATDREPDVEPHFVHLPPTSRSAAGIWAEVAMDGQVLFERGGELPSLLCRVRRDIAEGRIVRRGAHGTPYWMEGEARPARDYIRRAEVRLRALDVLFEGRSFADVVRESQEVVELALKGLLRLSGVEPPRVHDVSEVLLAERDRLPAAIAASVDELARISRDLRRDRELAFYGAEDLTPSEFYSEEDARRARDGARRTVAVILPLLSEAPERR
jgi:HEPN domain-containing protein/predicted nucleotidyltransferase